MATTARNCEVPADLADSVEAGERVVLTRKGAPVAAVVSIEDMRLLDAIEAEEDRSDAEAAAQALEDIRAGREQTVPLDQALAEFGLTRGDLPR